MGEPNIVGDYVVDCNLIGVKDAVIHISNCKFENNGAQKAIIKVAARGGPSDTGASDIPKDVAPATVKSLTVDNCTFVNIAEGAKALNIGTTSKTEDASDNLTGQYYVVVDNNMSDMTVSQPFNSFEIIVPAMSKMTKLPLTNIGTFKSVSSESELKAAIEDVSVSQISIKNSFELSENITINRPVQIRGNGKVINTSQSNKTITALTDCCYSGLVINNSGDNTEWSSTYALQCYTGTHELSDAVLSGGNAAVLVNGSKLILKGTIDVSGNSFGGIEVSKGSSLRLTASVLDISDAKLVNSTEAYGKPTIWVDGESEDIGQIIGGDSLTMIIKDGQRQYYLSAKNSIDK